MPCYFLGAGVAQSVQQLGYRLGFESRYGQQIFLFTIASRQVLKPT
jgi:hypothetical protein